MVELVIAIALVGASIWGVAFALMRLEGKKTRQDFNRYD